MAAAPTLATNGIAVDESEQITRGRTQAAVVYRNEEVAAVATVAGPISPTEACVAPTCYNNTLENRGKCFSKFSYTVSQFKHG